MSTFVHIIYESDHNGIVNIIVARSPQALIDEFRAQHTKFESVVDVEAAIAALSAAGDELGETVLEPGNGGGSLAYRKEFLE